VADGVDWRANKRAQAPRLCPLGRPCASVGGGAGGQWLAFAGLNEALCGRSRGGHLPYARGLQPVATPRGELEVVEDPPVAG
jgi:hypothetical protein